VGVWQATVIGGSEGRAAAFRRLWVRFNCAQLASLTRQNRDRLVFISGKKGAVGEKHSIFVLSVLGLADIWGNQPQKYFPKTMADEVALVEILGRATRP
jgi:hypothetical protein